MINIISPINPLGYGVAGLNITKELAKEKDIALWIMGQPSVTNQEDANILKQCLQNASMPDFNAPCLKIWHQNDMSQFVGRGERVGFPFFELDEFTDIEKHHLNSLDKLFVSSSWAKNIAASQLSLPEDKIFVVPLGVDSSIFKPSQVNNEGPTIFFNCGKWEVRKGHDLLYKIFNEAFSKEDNVELWMMTHNPFLSPEQSSEWENVYKSSSLGNKIRFINRVQTHEEVYNIMKECDCGIFPSRAEGWNLELLEMLSCGKQVIATNCSAHTEFCNKDNCLLVDTTNKEMAFDGIWFNGKVGSWAKIEDKQVSEFAELMREVHNKKQKQELTSNSQGVKTANNFSWTQSSNKIREYINV
tara:strand:+ start:3081 stop:4154 length:1074 start_codon:yes stop_codon:yes gene_type:complete